jgi:hypothetical protein
MKKLFLLVSVLTLVVLSTKISAQQSKQDFTLVNKIGFTINNLYITPHDSNEWGEDILGKDAMPSGDELDIQFHPKENVCIWDLRIEDKDGNYIEWENIDLCKWSKITLHYENKQATASFE